MPPLSSFGLAALLAVALAGCGLRIDGNGVFAEQTEAVGTFQRVDVGLGIEASVTVQAGAQAVVLSGDENLLPHIRVTVVDGTLQTSTRLEEFTVVLPLRLRISVPELSAVSARDAARVAVTGAAAPAFAAAAAGVSEVTLSGAGGADLTAALSDRSKLHATGYPVASATVAVADGSTAELTCSGPVTGSVVGGAHGASQVEVAGGGTCTAALSGGSTCGPP
jgi:hypothetical protein